METSNKIFITIVLIIFLKLIYNGYLFLQAMRFLNKYKEYLQQEDGGWYISDNRQQIIKILESAGIADNAVGYVESVGYGQIQGGELSVFNNIANKRKDIGMIIHANLREAKNHHSAPIQNNARKHRSIKVFPHLSILAGH